MDYFLYTFNLISENKGLILNTLFGGIVVYIITKASNRENKLRDKLRKSPLYDKEKREANKSLDEIVFLDDYFHRENSFQKLACVLVTFISIYIIGIEGFTISSYHNMVVINDPSRGYQTSAFLYLNALISIVIASIYLIRKSFVFLFRKKLSRNIENFSSDDVFHHGFYSYLDKKLSIDDFNYVCEILDFEAIKTDFIATLTEHIEKKAN